MTTERYRRNAGAVYSLKYHLVWCPKYRRAVLVGSVGRDLKALIQEKAEQLGATVHALEVMPDHVHLFVESDPTLPVQFLVNQFKGYTSRVLRERYPSLKSRLPSLWSRSYYAASVGTVSEATVGRYIEAQKDV
jgi:putative transposase